MPFENLAELLTGRALGIPKERLDMQGWVAAFRAYRIAMPDKQHYMELSLALAILQASDWEFVADAIYLARSLRMAHPLMRHAIMSVGLASQAAAPEKYIKIISAEARRYMRDVPQPETTQSQAQEVPDAAQN